MFYSDEIYNSVWCDFFNEKELQALLTSANPPKLTNQNFKINTWKYTAKNVPRLTAENLDHEWPDSTPFWKYIESSYKNAAKGFSQELVGKDVTRLCSYLNLRARPTSESVSIYTIHANQMISHMYNHQKGFASEWDVPYQIQLTGQFVDMPDGRWHYVFIKDELRLNTSLFSWRFLGKKFVEDEFIEYFKEMFGHEPTEDQIEAQKNSLENFYFAFVREDLIGKLIYPEFFDSEYLSQFIDSSVLEDAGNWIDYLYKEYPYWERKDAIEITYDEYGAEILNIDDLALSLLPKSDRENIKSQRQSLAATFSHYPGYWKPAGEPAYLVRKQSRTRGDWAQEIFKIVTGNSYELLSYRERLDFFRELYPGYQYPGYYEYVFEYYENEDIGYSYLYNLLPAYDLKHLKNDSYIALFNEDNPRNRVNAYPNGGNPDFMEDWADEIKANMDIENGTSDHNPSTEVVEKNVLAGAGVLALGLLLLKNNM